MHQTEPQVDEMQEANTQVAWDGEAAETHTLVLNWCTEQTMHAGEGECSATLCGVLRGCNLAAVPTPGQRLLLAPVHCTQAASCHAQLAAGAKWQAQGARLVRGTGR